MTNNGLTGKYMVEKQRAWEEKQQLLTDAIHVEDIEFKAYSASAVAESIDKGRTVVIYFGADWCSTCVVFELTVLKNKKLIDALKKTDNYIVDISNDIKNPERGAAIKLYQVTGVPSIRILKDGKVYKHRTPGSMLWILEEQSSPK